MGSVRGSHIINYNVSSALLLGRGWQPLSSTNNSLYILCFRLFANHDILLMGQVLHSKHTALAVSFDVFYHLPLNLWWHSLNPCWCLLIILLLRLVRGGGRCMRGLWVFITILMRSVFVNFLFWGFDRLVGEGELRILEKSVGNLGCTVVMYQVSPLKVWRADGLSVSWERSHLQTLFTLGIWCRWYLDELVLQAHHNVRGRWSGSVHGYGWAAGHHTLSGVPTCHSVFT